ncbi:hypothetical protein K2X85_08020 [bacterium]|nr:hypothetical protein [bacterium]
MSDRANVPRDLPKAARHKEVLGHASPAEARSIVRLVEQIEQDYQFRLGYLVIESLVRSAPLELVLDLPTGRTDDRLALALRENVLFHWAQSLPLTMRAFAYGRAGFEKTFRYDETSRGYLLAGLDYLPPEQSELILQNDGSFDGIELIGPNNRLRLEAARAWWFALDATVTEPYGKSRYLGAPYSIWQARRQLDQQERIWYSKFAIGHGVARAPDGTGPASDPSLDPMEVMREQLASIESGGILILSSRTGPDGKYLYDYLASEGQQASGPLERRREMLDVAALRSLGIPERAITQNDQSGSRAMAQVHLEVLYRNCEGILDQIVSSFSKYVVRPLIEYNWPAAERPNWHLHYRPIGDQNTHDPSTFLRELARQLALSPTLPDLAREQIIDVDRLLSLAQIPILRPWSQPTPARTPRSAQPADENNFRNDLVARLDSNHDP